MGSGFRTFTAGEVLTASNVQNYLMDQSVMVFGGSAARSSAIGTANFEEGMVSYLTDTDKVEAYNGTDWVSVAPTTSQGLTLINTTSFSGVASTSLPANTFTSAYENYRIILDLATSTSAKLQMRMRASGSDNTTANHNTNNLFNAGVLAEQLASQTSFTIGYLATTQRFWILDILAPQLAKNTIVLGHGYQDNSGLMSDAIKTDSTAYDSASFFGASGNITGKYSVYGYNF